MHVVVWVLFNVRVLKDMFTKYLTSDTLNGHKLHDCIVEVGNTPVCIKLISVCVCLLPASTP